MSYQSNAFYEQSVYQSCRILEGLITDHLEDQKALQWIESLLNILRGIRPLDVIYSLLDSGVAVSPEILCRSLSLSRKIDITIAETIQTLIQYRDHSCQKAHMIDCILSGKNYHGPAFNATVKAAKVDSFEYVRRLVENLHCINATDLDDMAMNL